MGKLRGRGVLPFCVEIKEVCLATFLRDRAARVKAASLAPLIAVIAILLGPYNLSYFPRGPLDVWLKWAHNQSDRPGEADAGSQNYCLDRPV